MEGIGLDLMDAKALLAKAKRPAVKAVLSTFIREMTAKELELLGAADGSDDEAENCARPASRSDARARATPRGAASEIASAGAPGEPEAPEPKAPPPSEKCADLLPPAPKRAPPPAAAPAAPAAPAPAFKKASEPALPTDVASPAPTKLVRPAAAAAPSTGNAKDWIVPAYGWEQGEYNSPWVNIMISIDGVGAAKDRSSCDFGVDSFDLRITDAGGKNYRLFVEALDKDIVPAESKILVKKNRVTVKLKKVKGEYSYDHWSDLKKKGGKAAKEKEKGRDPSAGIMDMMKDLYDNGDDNMRKIIGESMMKSQRGEKMDPKDVGPGEDDLGAKEGDLDVDADDITNDDFSMPAGLPAGLPKMPDLGKIPGMEDFKMPDGP